jgi:dTDP-3-amino-3,4,6-trideoxy-alpha-D-glucose transaminase
MEPKVLLNDFRGQWEQIRSAALAAIDRVGNSGWLILGNEVARFEQQLAAYSGVSNVVGCASGLDAIQLGLQLLKVRPGDRVITTPLSAFATTLAIIRSRGIPVFVDTDETGLLDLEKVSSLLAADKEMGRFLLPVHLFGHSMDLEILSELKKRYNLYVVEDCAQSIGATSKNRRVGTVGDVSAISFYPTKNLGCLGDGGALLTDDLELARMAKGLRDYGQTGKYLHSYIGMNSRLDELQAAILTDALLPLLPGFTQRRRKVAAQYRALISNAAIKIPPPPRNSNSVYHLFPIIVEGDREQFRQYLGKRGIETGVHYPTVLPDQPALRDQQLEIRSELTNAYRFAKQEVSLPIHPYLTNSEVERVVLACNTWQGL